MNIVVIQFTSKNMHYGLGRMTYMYNKQNNRFICDKHEIWKK